MGLGLVIHMHGSAGRVCVMHWGALLHQAGTDDDDEATNTQPNRGLPSGGGARRRDRRARRIIASSKISIAR